MRDIAEDSFQNNLKIIYYFELMDLSIFDMI